MTVCRTAELVSSLQWISVAEKKRWLIYITLCRGTVNIILSWENCQDSVTCLMILHGGSSMPVLNTFGVETSGGKCSSVGAPAFILVPDLAGEVTEGKKKH